MGVEYVPSEAERAANIKRNEAEAESALAEAKSFEAEARRTAAFAETAEIDLRKNHRNEDDELAKDMHHHVYVFDREVAEASVKACIQQMAIWSRKDPGCAIELQINSPGGSIFDGFALIDFVRGLRDQGHDITTVGIGMVASMAAVILQAGSTRVMGKHALLLIHEGSLGAIGDFGKVEDRVKLMELMHTKILDLFVERSNVNRAFIKKNWHRTDWWVPAEICLKHGFCDVVK